MNHDIISWIELWYKSQCDGDWEHTYGIKITTIDNPGWAVRIDLSDTNLENLTIPGRLVDNGDADWFDYKVENSVFTGHGDPSKLHVILNVFREIVLAIREIVLANDSAEA